MIGDPLALQLTPEEHRAAVEALLQWCGEIRARFAVVFCRHTDTIAFDHDRFFLRCDSCGRETCGIVVARARARLDTVR